MNVDREFALALIFIVSLVTIVASVIVGTRQMEHMLEEVDDE